MIPVKICGITNLEDAQTAVNCGASAIGFIFYNKSPRYIPVKTAREIVAGLNGKVSFVGVFVDEMLDIIHDVAEEVGLNFIQLHGNESVEYCHKVQLPIIKVFRIAPNFDVGKMKIFDVHAFLLDTYNKDKLGGTGETFNWNIIGDLQIDIPIILSGGLSVENIKNGINGVCPSAVDVNSGVESRPGVKDKKKIEVLFDSLKNTTSLENPYKIPVVSEGNHDL